MPVYFSSCVASNSIMHLSVFLSSNVENIHAHLATSSTKAYGEGMASASSLFRSRKKRFTGPWARSSYTRVTRPPSHSFILLVILRSHPRHLEDIILESVPVSCDDKLSRAAFFLCPQLPTNLSRFGPCHCGDHVGAGNSLSDILLSLPHFEVLHFSPRISVLLVGRRPLPLAIRCFWTDLSDPGLHCDYSSSPDSISCRSIFFFFPYSSYVRRLFVLHCCRSLNVPDYRSR